jgi:molecular chaperone DnaK (HSP70)
LTDEQVESMILDSFDNAEADFAKRLLIEARNEAETILAAVERAPESAAWALLTGDEQRIIYAARDVLKTIKQDEDAAAIRNATLALDQATRRFAELMMEAAVSSALTGKTMKSAGEDLAEAVTAPHAMAAAEFK